MTDVRVLCIPLKINDGGGNANIDPEFATDHRAEETLPRGPAKTLHCARASYEIQKRAEWSKVRYEVLVVTRISTGPKTNLIYNSIYS